MAPREQFGFSFESEHTPAMAIGADWLQQKDAEAPLCRLHTRNAKAGSLSLRLPPPPTWQVDPLSLSDATLVMAFCGADGRWSGAHGTDPTDTCAGCVPDGDVWLMINECCA